MLCPPRPTFSRGMSVCPSSVAPPPPPSGGRGSHGDIRWKAVSREARRETILLQHLPIQWTLVAIAIGGGADGEGELVSPPLSLSHKKRFAGGAITLSPGRMSFHRSRLHPLLTKTGAGRESVPSSPAPPPPPARPRSSSPRSLFCPHRRPFSPGCRPTPGTGV